MRERERVYAALTASGIKGTYVAYPVGKAPPLPWFTYREDDGGEFFADDSNYAGLPHYMARLFQEDMDTEVEDRLAAAVATIGPYRKTQAWSPTENCLITTFEFTLSKEDNNG
jgi:hypothetical protein